MTFEDRRAGKRRDADRDPFRRGRLDEREGPPLVLFGRQWEDAEIELAELPSRGHLLCVASAGCVALALARRGARVTAVDLNPAQIDYVRSRAAGGPLVEGVVDRMLALVRRRLRFLGLSDDQLEALLLLDDPAAQQRALRDRPNADRLREGLAAVASPLVPRDALTATGGGTLALGGAIDLAARIERCIARHPNRSNAFLWRLLLGRPAKDEPAPSTAPVEIEAIVADAVEHLERAAPASFDGFTFSNILDGATADDRARLLVAAGHAARPGAVAVLRSFAAAQTAEQAERAARDRSALWGTIEVLRYSATDGGWESL